MHIDTEKKLAAGLSILSNTIIIIMKFIAGEISGSISIISEAIHSLSDCLASVLTFFSVIKSSQPADEEHPFGHGRYEDMSGFIEGGLIIAAAFYIIYEAAKKLIFTTSASTEPTLGIIVMGISVIANFIVSSVLFHTAKKSNSVSLYADGEHLRTDIYSSLGVLVGLVLIKITGLHILDPIIAIIVAIFIFKAGFDISKTTLNNLLDGSLPKEDLEHIEKIINSFTDKGILGYKNLKTRRVGPSSNIEIILLFPKNMTILECHDICDNIEAEITKELGNCSVSIHAEPDCPCSHSKTCKKGEKKCTE